MPRLLAAIVALSAGCTTVLGDGDVPAHVAWLEAAVQDGELRARAVGSTGCGRLTALDIRVFNDGAIPVVHVFARGSKTELLCIAPNVFDSTVVLTPPPAANLFAISGGGGASQVDVQEFFVMRPNEPNVEAFAGGRGLVEGVEDGCPQTRIVAGRWTSIVYALDLPRDVELFDGDYLTLDGAFFEGVRSFCSEHRALRVSEVTLPLRPPS